MTYARFLCIVDKIHNAINIKLSIAILFIKSIDCACSLYTTSSVLPVRKFISIMNL